ncbi:MAG: 3-dehydroquinate synthase [Planctomycetota bacterium]|nr:3-dehydroquinate synthase [Planctomycetota bacterium]
MARQSAVNAQDPENNPAPLQRTRVRVPLGDRSYDIKISSGEMDQFAAGVLEAIPDLSHALVIFDQAVDKPWAEHFTSVLHNHTDSMRISQVSVPSGEVSKSIHEYDRLLNWTLRQGGDRKSVMIAIGGGVIGDLAGFVAASFARGIRFVQVPTTLLAMVDSSVGGKTGINLPDAKNMVGAFWQPSLVWIDTDVLSTLPERSYLSGLAEIVKYGVIDDADFFHWLEKNASLLVDREDSAVRYAIEKSCESKARVVGEDELETSGRRAILNYGHTFAHAIEATCGYGKLLHGEAVSIGMQMAARLAMEMGLVSKDLLEQQTQLLLQCKLPVTLPEAEADEMLPVMMKDKKVAHGKLRFILPKEIGKVELIGDVDEALVRNAISQTREP